MCDLCQSFNVNHIRVRISQCFYMDRLCVFLDRWINESGLDAVFWKSMGKQVVCTTVNVLSCYNVITCMCQVLEGICNSCCTGSYC